MWSPDRNSFCTQRAETKCYVTTVVEVQFFISDMVGYRSADPACLMGILVISWPVISPCVLFNSAGRKSSHRASFNFSNSWPMKEVKSCKNCHSCWREFCIPEYTACGWQSTIPAIFLTTSVNLNTLSPSQSCWAAESPTNILRCLLPITSLRIIPRNNYCAC